MTAWNLCFEDNTKIGFCTYDSSCGNVVDRMLKHLQHVAVPFLSTYDNPYARGDVYQNLVQAGKQLKIHIDPDRVTDQQYLNQLHVTYEQAKDVSLPWLNYHNCIHAVEVHNDQDYLPICWINYQFFGGPLAQPITDSLMSESTEQVKAGDIITDYSELGKPLYRYWLNNEPADINRLVTLGIPWRKFHPKLGIALDDINFKPQHAQAFKVWFDQYRQAYWDYHGRAVPPPDEWLWRVLPIGRVDDLPKLINLLKQKLNILKIESC